MQELGPYANGRALRMADALNRYINNPQLGTLASFLDPHQVQVVAAVGRDWMSNHKGNIKEPTGGGKTVIQAAIIEATRSVEPETQTLIVVPRIQLLQQITKDLRDLIPDLTISHYYGKAKKLTGEVVVTTYPSFVSGAQRGAIDPSRFKLVVYDEAHHLLPAQRVATSEIFSDSMHLGLTATPSYGKNRHVRDVLQSEISSTSIRQGVESNRLCSFSNYLVETGISLGDVRLRGREFDEASLQKAVNIAARNQAAVDLYKQAFDGRQTVSYCAGIEHARALAELFNYNGIRAAAVSSRQNDTERRKLIEQYQRGEIQVLCNADLLIEGFNDVKTSVILNLRPTLSPRLAEQRGGRALRLDRSDRGKYTYIVDFVDKVRGKNQPVLFAQVAEAAQIINTWYESKGGEPVGYVKPVILDLKDALFITNSSEVMWVVNDLSGSEFEIEPGLKSLRRISAETGISLDVLSSYAEILKDTFKRRHNAGEPLYKDVQGPHGEALRFYYHFGIFNLLTEVLYRMGYEVNPERQTSEETLENMFRDVNYYNQVAREVYFDRRLKNVDVDHVKKYAFEAFQEYLNYEEKIVERKQQEEEERRRNRESTILSIEDDPEIPTSLEDYKERVRKANGSLVPLRRTLPGGNRLYLQVRYFDVPANGRDENVDFRSWQNWRQERRTFGLGKILLVDVYMDHDGRVEPIGHLDWSENIYRESGQHTTASARANLHEYVIPKNDYEEKTREKFARDKSYPWFSSWVEREFRGLGIGSLMLATSGTALQAKGFNRIHPGALADPEDKVYSKLGITEEEKERTFPIERLTDNPKANGAILKYLTSLNI